MPERIITDESGDRWDVTQSRGGEREPLVFRHQSGRRVTLEGGASLDALSDDELLRLLRDAGRERGVGEEGRQREGGADPEGYVTRPDASDRP